MQTATLLKFFIIIFDTKHMMYEGCLVSNRRLLAIGGWVGGRVIDLVQTNAEGHVVLARSLCTLVDFRCLDKMTAPKSKTTKCEVCPCFVVFDG